MLQAELAANVGKGVQEYATLKREPESDGHVPFPPLAPVSELTFELALDGHSGATLVSCAAGIVPSPDFFVGFAAVPLCIGDGTYAFPSKWNPLHGWDADTDNGEWYDSGDRPAPAGQGRHIKALLGFPPRFGTYSFAAGGSGVTNEPRSEGEGRRACFPADELLWLANGTQLPMSQLRPRFHFAAQSGGGASSLIVFVSHAEPGVLTEFVCLTLSDGGVLRLSPGHYAYTPYGGLIAAGKVVAGNHLANANGTMVRVDGIARVLAVGLYAPNAASGEMIVSGVRVSCYTTAMQPALAHAVITVLAKAPNSVMHAAQSLYDCGGGVVFAMAGLLKPLFGGKDTYSHAKSAGVLKGPT